MSTMLTPELGAAIRERRGFKTDHLIATYTKGGTYVIASAGKWNDNGKPRDLVAILPGNLGQGRVLALYIAVNPALVAEIEAVLDYVEPDEWEVEPDLIPVDNDEAVRLANEGARRVLWVFCPRCERGHEGACKR